MRTCRLYRVASYKVVICRQEYPAAINTFPLSAFSSLPILPDYPIRKAHEAIVKSDRDEKSVCPTITPYFMLLRPRSTPRFTARQQDIIIKESKAEHSSHRYRPLTSTSPHPLVELGPALHTLPANVSAPTADAVVLFDVSPNNISKVIRKASAVSVACHLTMTFS